MAEDRLLKIARLAHGNDWFLERVKAACWVLNVEYTEDVLRACATDPAIIGAVTLTDGTTVNAANVADSDIERVVNTFAGK